MMPGMWTTLFFFTHTTLSLVIIARVLLRPRVEPSVRLAWIMVVEAVPLLGIAAYLLFGEVRMKQAEVQRMSDVRDRLTGLRTAVPASAPTGPTRGPDHRRERGGGRHAGRPGNSLQLLEESDGAIDDLVAAIDAATDHVHLLFYIWLPDASGTKVAQALCRAEDRGVQCRVIVDALGSRSLVRSELWDR